MTTSEPTQPLTDDTDVGRENVRITPGTLLAHRYIIREILGQGGQSRVFSALDLDPIPPILVALKVALPSQRFAGGSSLHDEASMLHHIHETTSTKHVVRGLGSSTSSANGLTYVVQELVDGPTLGEILAVRKMLAIERVIDIAFGLAQGLVAIHAAGVVHRDLKPSNVRMRAGQTPVLIDLGAACYVETIDETEMRPAQLTRAYAAPEVLEGGRGSSAADIYSFGIVVAEMATGTRPSHYAPDLRSVDRRLVYIVQQCLDPLASRRPSASELTTILPRIAGELRRRHRIYALLSVAGCFIASSLIVSDTNCWEKRRCNPQILADSVLSPFSPVSLVDQIFWSNISGKQVMSVPTAGGRPRIVAEMDTFCGRITALDQRIYWLTNRGALWTLIDDEPTQLRPDIVTEGALPGMLVGRAGRLYWNEASGTLRQWSIRDGTERVLLNNSDGIWELAVDDSAIYWTEHTTRRVRRLSIDGDGSPEVIADKQLLPDGIAVDETHVYWHNEGEGTIKRRGKTAGAIETIVEDKVGSTRIIVDERHVYWTSTWGGQIKRADKNGKNVVVLATAQATPIDIAVDDTALYWTTTVSHGRVMKCRK